MSRKKSAPPAKPLRQAPASGAPDTAPKKPAAKSKPEVRGTSKIEEEPSVGKDIPFPIVAVGASAGGLEAFSDLLRHLAPDTGMGFVLVQHLDPHHTSALPELLARETVMPVHEITDGLAVQPDHIYVIPPNANLAILHGVLHLMPRSQERGQHLAIDYFMRSLAEDHGSKAIGVILSGTASDGVMGLKAIKAEGGITFSQDEQSAKYDGMPHSAIVAGCVDFVLPPQNIATELMRIARHPFVAHAKTAEPSETLPGGEGVLNKIFILLRRHTGVDFAYYKRTTVLRRIKRRMLLHRLEKLADFVKYLQDNPAEIDALYQDILINVTSFFRDPDAFDVLKDKVLPQIVAQDRVPEGPIRIWVAGCSTGEEAYSIAISLMEHLGNQAANIPIQIFATDIDEQAVEKARAGIYSEAITQDVSAERLRRFFVKTEGGYQVAKPIRDLCLFARQNVVKDPPFSKLDLVSCRNLLIYLGPVLQKKALSLFHYALKPTGFLFLGSAKTIGEFADLFRLVDQKHKIYGKKSIATPLHYDFSTPVTPGSVSQTYPEEKTISPAWSNSDLRQEVDQLILKRYGPPGVLIDEHMDILQFRGHTGAYLEPAPGEASLNLLKMARESLLLELHGVVGNAIRDNVPAHKKGVRIKQNQQIRQINIEVTPVRAPAGAGRCFLVLFEEMNEPEPKKEGKQQRTGETAENQEVQQLRQELAATKEYLQSVIEQQESTNEELRSANEEIQSSNEELQSINEELETAKEELQSVNEELATVNDELESRNTQLGQANNDLSNLVNNVSIPIVIVGSDLRIRRYTPPAEKMLNLIPADIGRPISDIRPSIADLDLKTAIPEVLDKISAIEVEKQDGEGRWYSVRIRPYKTLENKIDGAVIAFVDIDPIKRSYDIAKDARDYSQALVAALKHPLLVLDEDLRVSSASAAYLDTFQVTQKDTLDNLLYRLGNGQWGGTQVACRTAKNFDGWHAVRPLHHRT
jgi:two-component system CheB/CheR fusion protein